MPNWLPEIQNVVWNRNFEKLNMRNRFIQEGLKRFVKSMLQMILLKLDQGMGFTFINCPSVHGQSVRLALITVRKLRKAVTINEIKEFMEKRFENVSLLWNRHLTFWIFDLAFFKSPPTWPAEDHSQFIWPYIFICIGNIWNNSNLPRACHQPDAQRWPLVCRKLTVRIYSIWIVDIRLKLFTYK